MIKKLLALLLIAGNAVAGPNYYEPPRRSPAPNAILYVPYEAPSATCKAVALWDDEKERRFELVHQTFVENFDSMPALANGDGAPGRWAPHLDGGHNGTIFTGSTWENKRAQTVSHEQQIYTDPSFKGSTRAPLGFNPFNVADGVLTITAERTPEALYSSVWGYPFTSGLLSSHELYAQQYGYFEISAKVPLGSNLLPAFWLLPTDRTSLPEIDIMEAPANRDYEGKIAYTTHWLVDGDRLSTGCTSPVAKDGKFHTYSALLLPDRVVFYFDRVAIGQVATREGADKDFYMMANLAVGGDWVGFVTPSNQSFPRKMEVDYMAAYTKAGRTGCAKDERGVLICR
jgi:beta-glucanase (GH16 family)